MSSHCAPESLDDNGNSPLYYEELDNTLQPAAQYYFDRQTIVLRACGEAGIYTCFHASQYILSRESQVFSDMFEVGSSSQTSAAGCLGGYERDGVTSPHLAESMSEGALGQFTMGGFPLVEVHDDAWDMQQLMSCLHDTRRYFEQSVSRTYKATSALLRLATKYQIDFLRKDMIDVLLRYYPCTWSSFIGRQTVWPGNEHHKAPDLSAVYDLALKTNATVLLPTLSYLIYLTRAESGPPTTPPAPAPVAALSHHLDEEQLARIDQGGKRLSHRTLLLILRAGIRVDDESYAWDEECKSLRCSSKRRAWVFARCSRNEMLGPHVPKVDEASLGCCKNCTRDVKTLYEDGCEEIWEELPGMFGFGRWESLERGG